MSKKRKPKNKDLFSKWFIKGAAVGMYDKDELVAKKKGLSVEIDYEKLIKEMNNDQKDKK